MKGKILATILSIGSVVGSVVGAYHLGKSNGYEKGRNDVDAEIFLDSEFHERYPVPEPVEGFPLPDPIASHYVRMYSAFVYGRVHATEEGDRKYLESLAEEGRELRKQ